MIKKKINEDLRAKDIEFEMLNQKYKAIRFYQSKMTLDVMLIDDVEKQGIINIPFAHLPKATKKILKPN